MKAALYRAAAEGKPEDYYEALRQMAGGVGGVEVITPNGNTVLHVAALVITPNGNTVLHVAALYAQKHFVENILKQEEPHNAASMLLARNNKNETVLHCAAEKGYADIVSVLIGAAKKYEDVEHGETTTMIRMTDNVKDPALHKAVRMGRLEVVKLLVEEDTEFEYPVNDAGETPIYIAAELQFHDCLLKMLNTCKKPTYGGPLGRNALHAAILSGFERTLSVFEIAIQTGKSILERRHVDTIEMMISKGQNVLHEAVVSNRVNVIKHIQSSNQLDNLVHHKDEDGNTPLHLVDIYNCDSIQRIINEHPMLNYMAFNKKHQTLFDLAALEPKKLGSPYRFMKMKHFRSGRKIARRVGLTGNPKQNNTDEEEEEIKVMMRTSETNIVVATLILTMTFAAGFTDPGGYDSNPGKTRGMPILLQNLWFKAFTIADTFGFLGSICSILLHNVMVGEASTSRKYKTILELYLLQRNMLCVACIGVVVAFLYGMLATLEQSGELALTIFCLGFSIGLGNLYRFLKAKSD